MLLAQPSFLVLPLQAVDDLGRCLGSPDVCQLHCVYGFRGVDASRFRVPASCLVIKLPSSGQKSWVWESVRAFGGRASCPCPGLGPAIPRAGRDRSRN